MVWMGIMPLLWLAVVAADAPVPVTVLARDVARGDVLEAQDLATADVAVAVARGAVSRDAAVGLEARRNLAAGAVLRAGDLMPPLLVRRGEPVSVRLIEGSLTIAASGRALASGGRGDVVRVVTAVSNRTIDGIVDGTGSVRISAP